MGGGGHQAEVYSRSGGGYSQTIAGGHGFPGSGPSSGSGGSDGGKVAAASDGACDSTRAARISSKIRPQEPGGGEAQIAAPRG